MTVIGKILTFLVFFLSIVFLGFAIRINMLNKDTKTGQSWRTVAENLREKMKPALEKDLEQKELDLTALRGQIKKLTDDLRVAKDNAAKELKQEQDLRATAEGEARQAKTNFMNVQVIVKEMEDELKRRREEVVANQATIKQRDIAIADYQAKVTKAENEKIQQTVAADTFMKRAQSLEKQVTNLTKELEQQRIAETERLPVGPERALISRPPPDDVKGIVKSVSGDLVTVSIGSDAGLLRGHTLEVFRLDPKPQYFGRIQIVDVGPHEAVGKLQSPKFAKLVQPNDQVASKILPSVSSR